MSTIIRGFVNVDFNIFFKFLIQLILEIIRLNYVSRILD